MPPAARITDSTSHGGTVSGPGATTVLIGGKPAALLGDSHVCAIYQHASNALAQGSSNVMIGGSMAARVGDTTACGASIVAGDTTVMIGG